MNLFGPVPSRRLGHSLGINHIPPKTCTYSCIYCQLGRTDRLSVARRAFSDPDEICRAVGQRLGHLRSLDEPVDYVTFVPDGEPTLDTRLGDAIGKLNVYKIPVAVITNASLLFMEEVQEDVAQADWVSVKIDAADPAVWKKINRPHRSLDLSSILEGIYTFSKHYTGTLVTETMLVAGYNDNPKQADLLAEHLSKIQPDKAYLLVPTRPPAENSVQRPNLEILKEIAARIAMKAKIPVSLISGDEDREQFFFGDDPVIDLLKTIAVHPVQKDVVFELIKKRNLDEETIHWLVRQNLVIESEYEGKTFYRKNIQVEVHPAD